MKKINAWYKTIPENKKCLLKMFRDRLMAGVLFVWVSCCGIYLATLSHDPVSMLAVAIIGIFTGLGAGKITLTLMKEEF